MYEPGEMTDSKSPGNNLPKDPESAKPTYSSASSVRASSYLTIPPTQEAETG